MATKEIILKIVLSFDKRWAENLTADEISANVRGRLDHCLGFRGEVKKLRVIKSRKKKVGS